MNTTQSQPHTFTKMAIANTLQIGELNFLKQLCIPLESLGINSVFYSRFMGKNRINCLSNNAVWLRYLYDNIERYKRNFESQFHFRKGFSVDLLNIFPKDGMVLNMFEHGMKNAIYLTNVSKDKKFSEVFIFATSQTQEESNQLLYENLNQLHQFTLLFKEKAHALIQTTRVCHPELNNIDSLHESETQTQNNAFEVKRYYLDAPNDNLYLTRTQFLHLKAFLLGKSTKQMALQFNTSVRTVETHLQLIKEKLGCNSKERLIEMIKF